MKLLLTDRSGFETLIPIHEEPNTSLANEVYLAGTGVSITTENGNYTLVTDDYFVCEWCGNTGEITEYDTVYPGEPHMAPIGIKKCPHLSESNTDDYE